MKHQATTIVRPWWGKLPACRQIEIASRFCSSANFLETSLRAGHPEHGRDKAFHSPAPVGVAVPDLPASPGLCSIRAVEVLWRMFPATSLFLCAISSPADRSDSFGNSSPTPRLTRRRGKSVFTLTQVALHKYHFLELAFVGRRFKTVEI